MNDLISIILPVYDRETLLPDCIRSIQAQSHQNFELLLIDDGSTDGTPALCKKYAAEDPRIRFLPASHSGVSAARNLGLDAATGEYVFFVDSDDAIHPLLLETLSMAMAQYGAGLGGTKLIYVPEDKWSKVDQAIKKDCVPSLPDFRDHETTLESVFRFQQPIFGLIGGVMLRRELIGQTRFRTDLYIGEDFYFIYENLIKGTSSVYLDRWWYYCRMTIDCLSNDRSYEAFCNRYLRRELVWKNEEALGRPQNADHQKRSAFHIYLSALTDPGLPKADRKKMQTFMKQHRKVFFSAMGLSGRMKFYLFVYFPFTYPILHKLKKSVQKC